MSDNRINAQESIRENTGPAAFFVRCRYYSMVIINGSRPTKATGLAYSLPLVWYATSIIYWIYYFCKKPMS